MVTEWTASSTPASVRGRQDVCLRQEGRGPAISRINLILGRNEVSMSFGWWMTATPRGISTEIIMGHKETRLDSVQPASEYNKQFYPYTRGRIYVRLSSCSFYMVLLSAYHQLPTHTHYLHGVIGHAMWVSPKRATVSALRCYPQKWTSIFALKNIEGVKWLSSLLA